MSGRADSAHKCIHVLLRDGVLWGIRFRLNRPVGAILGLSDEVNPGIRPPPTGPLVPQQTFFS